MIRVEIPRHDDGTIDREAWRRARHSIGAYHASDAAALYGAHPFRNLGDVATSHLTDLAPENSNASQNRGHYLEPGCLAWLADHLDVPIAPPTHMYVHGPMAQTPDGEISDTDQPEAKTTRDYWNGQLPAWVRVQAVAQCVARPTLERVHVVWLDASMEFGYECVEPTVAELDDLTRRAESFMAFIGMGLWPQGVEASYENLVALHPRPAEPEETIDLADAELDVLREYATARLARLDAERIEKDAKGPAAELFRGTAGVLRHNGLTVATWRAEGRNGRVLRPTKHVFTNELQEVAG